MSSLQRGFKDNSNEDEYATLLFNDFLNYAPREASKLKTTMRMRTAYVFLSKIHNITTTNDQWSIVKRWESLGLIEIRRYWGFEIISAEAISKLPSKPSLGGRGNVSR